MGFRNWPARLFVVEWLRIGRFQALVEPAGNLVLGRGLFDVNWFEGRFALGALGFGDGAAGLERAAFGWIIVRGDVAGERNVFLFASRIGLGNGFQQGLGVWMLGRGVEFSGRGPLDKFAKIHHADFVADMLDDGKIVRDKKEGDSKFFLQVADEIEHLALHRDVEGGDGFVGDDEFWFKGEGARDADALALSAGEFVRVTVGDGST